jgi:hypothetical protein
MDLPGAARTPGVPRRIDAQNNSGNFLSAGPLSFGIEQAQVRYRVPLVVSGKDRCRWSDIIDCGITWR